MATPIISVTVSTVPGKTSTITLQQGNTVSDALREDARISLADVANYSLKVNGMDVQPSHVLEDGDGILITKQIKGNL